LATSTFIRCKILPNGEQFFFSSVGFNADENSVRRKRDDCQFKKPEVKVRKNENRPRRYR
jgi:hypothetical protein